MAKPEWGTKRTCQNCGARFYDLRRNPIHCPVCGTEFDADRPFKARRGGAAAKVEAVGATSGDAVPPVAKVESADAALEDVETVAETDDVEVEADDTDPEELEEIEENGDLIEDPSDLGEDDDDIGEVMEHLDDDVEDKP